MNVRITGSGPAILFLHGIPTNGHLWDLVVPKMQADYRCVVVDLPGMGNSPPLANNSLNPDDYAVELDKLRTELSIDSWHVVGHDAGATIAVHYTSQFGEKVKKLTICAPPVFPELKIPSFFKLLRPRFVGDLLAPIIKPFIFKLGLPAIINPQDEKSAAIVKAFQQSYSGWKGTRKLLNILRWGEPEKVLKKTAALLSSITARTLVLQGKADRTIPLDFAVRASETIANAEMHVINGSHFFPVNSPDEFCGHLIPFLNKSS